MQASPFFSASPPAAKKMIEYIDMSISLNIFVSPSSQPAHHIDSITLETGHRQIQKYKKKYLYLCQLSMWSDAGKVEDLPQSHAKGPHVRFCCVPTLKI